MKSWNAMEELKCDIGDLRGETESFKVVDCAYPVPVVKLMTKETAT